MSDNLEPFSDLLDPKIEASPGFTRRVLLGFFIVGQLWFLVTTNMVGAVQDIHEDMPDSFKAPMDRIAPDWPKQQGHTHDLFAGLLNVNRAWEQVTGQYQKWSLFPSVSRDWCVFPALELRWGEDDPMHPPRVMLSDNEPPDINNYFRLGLYRIRKIEGNVVTSLAPDENETDVDRKKRWKERIGKFVWKNHKLLHEYLKFRLRQLEERDPALAAHPPEEVILTMRRFHVCEPKEHPEMWTGPHTEPVARWHPHHPRTGFYELEWYDHETQTYQSFPKR